MMENKNDLNQGWNFDNTYVKLPSIFFTKTKPKLVPSPNLIKFNDSLALNLGLKAEFLLNKTGAEVFSGNALPHGSDPIAQAYAGHQFGYFTMLGDGRAILLGEQITPTGNRIDIQLKGAGRTPYSRGGDGRASLGPMLREYIISEAMYGLGIPTTRSLAVVTTGEWITREEPQIGAILTRIASSHLRVGTFEYAAKWGNIDELKSLADYALKRHFPDFADKSNKYLYLLQEVIKKQAQLIAKWQLVGFIHGVMNTDNITISGETIDYGPCAFMDTYDPNTVFSSIDMHGRYAYGNQPQIGAWDLSKLAEALLQLLDEDKDKAIDIASESISNYGQIYRLNYLSGMRSKLGIHNEEAEDDVLIKNLLDIMHKYKADYTNTFRALTLQKLKDMKMFCSSEFIKWHELWQERLNRQNASKEDIYNLMKKSNPSVIPRNHRVEEALKSAVEHSDYSVMNRLLDVLSCPYDYTTNHEEYAKLPPKSDVPYRTFCGT
ncbi:YdiU family protein [Clostridiaceae bacterium M8S5]|nr:YdiU family protein [Clostridiaceae bacterium M8S5]